MPGMDANALPIWPGTPPAMVGVGADEGAVVGAVAPFELDALALDVALDVALDALALDVAFGAVPLAFDAPRPPSSLPVVAAPLAKSRVRVESVRPVRVSPGHHLRGHR